MKMNKEETGRERIALFESIAGLFFAGAFIFATRFFNQGNNFAWLEVLAEIAGGGFIAVLLGLGAKKLFQLATDNCFNRTSVWLIILFVIALTVLLLFLARFVSRGAGDFRRCEFCERRVEAEASIEFGGGSICSDCFYEKISTGELGYCERCCEAVEIRDMKAGFCLDCFDEFVQFRPD